MNFAQANALKRSLLAELHDETSWLYIDKWRSGYHRSRRGPLPTGTGIALGVSQMADGSYGIAIRVQEKSPSMRELACLIKKQADEAAEIQVIGRVWAHASRVTTTLPLRPGLSIGHGSLGGSGTLGAFVRLAADSGVYVLSNNHVLAASNRGKLRDPIVQPGRKNGGRKDNNRVGELANFVELKRRGLNEIDAAICRLDDVPHDARWPSGPISATAEAKTGDNVAKLGMRTDSTAGVVKAVDVVNFAMDYSSLGSLVFDHLVEVQPPREGHPPFSLTGDSGSLVFKPETSEAVGLLIGGRSRGVDNGPATSYFCRLEPVLKAFNASLLS